MHRAIYDAIMAHLRELGPVHTDVVAVGVFLKRDMKFATERCVQVVQKGRGSG
jgi:hypothetical protein